MNGQGSTYDEFDSWQPTEQEWEAFVDKELARLGVSHEELARQARERDFQSPDAHSLWMMIGGVKAGDFDLDGD